MSSRTAFAHLATISALALTATTVGVDAAGVARASTSTEPPTGASADTIDGLFDVGGGRNLYLHCEGTGSPTIVYLHGAGGTSSNAGEVPSLLSDDYRVCVYDRPNVGRSDPAEGPVSAAGTVEDLHTLLDVAEVPGPYVLLGASRGGGVAFAYAGTHPTDVAGLVLLDSDVPGTTDWIVEFLDPELLIPVDEFRDLWLNELWKDDPELMNEFGLGEAIDAAAGTVPAVPAILLIPEGSEAPPDFGEGAAEAYRELQEAAMDLFEPGEVRIVASPHYMEPEIPEEIAAAVREVIGASTAAEASATSAPTTSN